MAIFQIYHKVLHTEKQTKRKDWCTRETNIIGNGKYSYWTGMLELSSFVTEGGLSLKRQTLIIKKKCEKKV